MADGGAEIALDAGERESIALPRVPDWARTARVGGLYLQATMSDQELDRLLRERLAEHVSVIEIDTRLSYYLTGQELDQEVAFLDRVARKAHTLGMRAVIYYPSLEVITLDGQDAARSMFEDHPEWVQRGIDGVWLDGTLYLGTGAAWAGTEIDARIAFRQWSRARARARRRQ